MNIALIPMAFSVIVALTARNSDPPVKLDPIPAGLSQAVESQMTARREELRELGRKMNAAMDSFEARCPRVGANDGAYKGCIDEKRELECGFAEMNELRRMFNLDLEGAARMAGIATTLTLTNVTIEGEVNFPVPEGADISSGKIATMRIPPGTKIVTGPTGRFRASIPGGQSFEVGGGARLTLDNAFLNPRSSDKVDVNLAPGFFRWLRQSVESLKERGRGTGRSHGRPAAVCAVRA